VCSVARKSGGLAAVGRASFAPQRSLQPCNPAAAGQVANGGGGGATKAERGVRKATGFQSSVTLDFPTTVDLFKLNFKTVVRNNLALFSRLTANPYAPSVILVRVRVIRIVQQDAHRDNYCCVTISYEPALYLDVPDGKTLGELSVSEALCFETALHLFYDDIVRDAVGGTTDQRREHKRYVWRFHRAVPLLRLNGR
jgi:hypothetical protein